MSEECPNPPLPGTSVLIVGLSADALARTAAIVAPHGLEVRMTTLVKLRADTMQLRPLVVLVDAYLYDFDPEDFDKVASDGGAKLGVVSDAKDAEGLLARMLRTSTPTPAASKDDPKSSTLPGFTTARYDAKTLQDALQQMGSPRPEFTTAKYDVKTLEEALERMGVPHLGEETSPSDASRKTVKRSDNS